MEAAQAQRAKAPSAVPLFIAVLLIPAVLGSSTTIFNDGDVSWHIATGLWILDHHAIPHADPFSFTWAGKPWVPIEWLSELIYAAAYRAAGYGGIAALVTAALFGLHAIIYANVARSTRFALLPILGMDLVLVPMLLARPHLLTWPLLAGWVWLMLRARAEDRAPPLIVALLMTIWANLHGGFVLGLAIAAAFGLEALVAAPDKLRALRQWLLFGVACLIAVCINGNGIEGVLHPLQFTRFQMLPLIDEWKPSSLSKTPFFFAMLAITLALIAWKRPRLSAMRWLVLAALLAMALLQMRHQAMAAIVAAMLLPRGFARGGSRLAGEGSKAWTVAAVGAVLLVAVRALMPLQPPENEANPWKLIAAVPPALRTQPVLNSYSIGGPLILSGIRPYIDGRGDMYGDPLVVGYARIVHGDAGAFDAAVNRWNIRWAIVGNNNKALVGLLEHAPGWRRVVRDKVGAIYVRAPNASGSPRAPGEAGQG